MIQQFEETTQIYIPPTALRFGEVRVIYKPALIDPGKFGTFHIYADDPTFSGGKVEYQATESATEVVAREARIYFGCITTAPRKVSA